MARTAPVCNVTVTAPFGDPSNPKGFRVIPPGSSLQQVIDIVNQNFSPQTQDDEFDRRLAQDLGTTRVVARSSKQQPQQGRIPKQMDDKLRALVFTEKAIVRRKIKVVNPEDKRDYVIDDRVVSLVMTDRRTGATWVWKDKDGAGGGGEAPGGNPDATISGG